MKLDFSKFKKVRVEKDHTTLQHPEGHVIKIAHAPLSKDMKKQLDSLPHLAYGTDPKTGKTVQFAEEPVQSATKEQVDEYNQFASKANDPNRPQVKSGEGISDNSDIHDKKYAKGGVVNNPKLSQSRVLNTGVPKSDRTDGFNEAKKNSESYISHQMMAEGGTAVQPQPSVDPDKAQSAQDSMRKAFHFKDGGRPSSSNSDQSDSHSDLAKAILNLSQKFTIPEIGSSVNQSNPQQSVQDSAPQPDQSVPYTAPQAPSQVPDNSPSSSAPLINQAQQNVGQENAAESASAQNVQQAQGENANIYGQQAEQASHIQNKYEEIGNDLHNRFERTADGIEKGQIDPNRWWDSKGTGSKILSAIGMLFAGAGTGVAGHPELAGQAIDNAINRDIDSQKANLGKQESLLSKYMDMYNNLPMAENAARLTMNAAAEGLINQQAAKLGSANAVNAATMANSQRRQQLLPALEGLARSQAMMGMYGSMGPQKNSNAENADISQSEVSPVEQAHQKRLADLQVLNPELYKTEEAKYIPGVGVTTKPMPDKVIEELTARKDLSQKLAELENFSREHSGTILDRAVINQGAALARGVQDAYRRGNAQGVFREAEKDFVEKSISSDPTKFFSKYRSIPGYQQVRKMNDDTIKTYDKAYGLKPFNSPQADMSNVQTMGGVQYKKVPGGWQKVQ